ncbi:hypothetical protein HMPREF2578_05905 [Staphylococcus sp. HMSC072H03]|uniref:hypothetical protein n=1 Tax=Staphylococcus sp. HMSC072H03 TaxID=1715057 RepID=UPI0008C45ABE|nr:hypothetical protein [Staphylococcus sp. HMSC072H03]OFN25157.1 hypothetical protein HMPREF2578_05905 [Staphylococcus sp. HMSC072H03]
MKRLKNIQLYRFPRRLDTSSYFKFLISIFKEVPTWYWVYSVIISIVFSVLSKDASYFKTWIQYPQDNIWLNLYTFLAIILLPVPLVYIRFVKSFSFTSFYIGLVKNERDSAERKNDRFKRNRDKVYSTDEFEFTRDSLSGRLRMKNISAEKRQKMRASDLSGFILIFYPIFYCFFLMVYMLIMYHIIIPVALLVALHILYKYNKYK